MVPLLILSGGLKTHLAFYLAWLNTVVPTKKVGAETGSSALHEEVTR